MAQLNKGLDTRAEKQTNTPNSPTGKHHLLVIGIDAYQHGVPPLNNAVRDAQRFYKLMLEKYDFTPSTSQLLIDNEATRASIVEAFGKLAAQLTAADNLVFYFSGHGHLDPNTQHGYWLPVDAVMGKLGTYLANEEILKFIKSTKAKHVFGIVDSCYSGSLFVTRALTETTKRLYSIPSRWLLTAGRKELVSDGSLGDHSPFAKSLLTQLEANTRQAFGVAELWLQMREGVISNARQTPRCEPLQNAHHMGGEFFFLQKGTPPPPEIMESPDTPVIFTDTRGNETMMKITDLEQQGLRRQADLLVRKMQALQEALILEDDPSRQFKYEHQVDLLEKQLKQVKDRLL